ncbi:hypothetical protein ACFQZ4_26750 [Catellatospora coxensis]
MTELFSRRRALLAGTAGLAALAGGGFWLAGRGSGAPAVAANWQDPAVAPSASASPESATALSAPVQPGRPGWHTRKWTC